jgi:hypothetical protein
VEKASGCLFHLESLQEQASDTVSSAMTTFVQRTGVVKEVCIPYTPSAMAGSHKKSIMVLLEKLL